MSLTVFENMSLVEGGVILSCKSKEQKEISFSEIDKIYITVNKVTPVYVFLFIMVSTSAMLISLWVMAFDLVQGIPLLLIVLGAVKLNNYKRYGMVISFKNGGFLEQRVPLKLKYKAIDFVNKIRKELFVQSVDD